MPEMPGVRRTLELVPVGTTNLVLELRSGESLRGEYLGLDQGTARFRADEIDEAIELEEIIGAFIENITEGAE